MSKRYRYVGPITVYKGLVFVFVKPSSVQGELAFYTSDGPSPVQTTGRLFKLNRNHMEEIHMNPSAIPAPAQYPPQCTASPAPLSSANLFEQAQAAAEREAADAKAAALSARITADQNLADATAVLLQTLPSLFRTNLVARPNEPSYPLAAFRKELQPLAASYGAKIVLVGNRNAAVLVTL